MLCLKLSCRGTSCASLPAELVLAMLLLQPQNCSSIVCMNYQQEFTVTVNMKARTPTLFSIAMFLPKLDCEATDILSFSAPLKIYLQTVTKWYMEEVCSHICSHTRVSSPLHALSFSASYNLTIWPSMYFCIHKQKICVNKSLLYAVKCWSISQLIAVMCILDHRADGLYLEALQSVACYASDTALAISPDPKPVAIKQSKGMSTQHKESVIVICPRFTLGSLIQLALKIVTEANI